MGVFTIHQSGEYYYFDRFDILQNLVVPESQHPVPFNLQPSSSIGVIRYLLGVLPTVQFYNHPSLKAHKIDYVVPNGLLATKLVPKHLTHAKVFP